MLKMLPVLLTFVKSCLGAETWHNLFRTAPEWPTGAIEALNNEATKKMDNNSQRSKLGASTLGPNLARQVG